MRYPSLRATLALRAKTAVLKTTDLIRIRMEKCGENAKASRNVNKETQNKEINRQLQTNQELTKSKSYDNQQSTTVYSQRIPLQVERVSVKYFPKGYRFINERKVTLV